MEEKIESEGSRSDILIPLTMTPVSVNISERLFMES